MSTDSKSSDPVSSSSSSPAPVPTITKFIRSSTSEHSKIINDFAFLRPIGEGAYATVELVIHLPSGQQFAMKKFSKSRLRKIREYGTGVGGRPKMTTALEKVYKEIEIMKQLNHPNIARVYSVLDDPEEDNLYLQLEYCHYGALSVFDDKIKRFVNDKLPRNNHNTRGLNESFLRICLYQTLSGLAYLHSMKVVHRDIKPDNLLLSSLPSSPLLSSSSSSSSSSSFDWTRGFELKLGDFGVARQFDPSEDGQVIDTQGTYHFYSPEMCEGERYDAYKADAWMVGLTYYILSMNTLPYYIESGNPQQLFDSIIEKELEWPSGSALENENGIMSPGLMSVLKGLCHKDPTQRLSVSEAMKCPYFQDLHASTSVESMFKGLKL